MTLAELLKKYAKGTQTGRAAEKAKAEESVPQEEEKQDTAETDIVQKMVVALSDSGTLRIVQPADAANLDSEF